MAGSEQGRASRKTLMVYRISIEADVLRAELFDRESVEETRSFLRAAVRENAKHRCTRILILVRSSKPIFQVEPHRLVEYFEELSGASPHKIALVGDTADLHMSHEYIELIARQRGLNVCSFREEAAALPWLNQPHQLQERRQRQERRGPAERRVWKERRLPVERRQGQRRGDSAAGAPSR